MSSTKKPSYNKSPSGGSKKGRKDVDYSTQRKMTTFFQSPKPSRKSDEAPGSPPPSKKRKSVEDPLPEGIITVSSSESDADRFCEEESTPSPNRKIVKKRVVKKITGDFMSIDPLLKKDPQTPSKPARNALVSLNIDKQKKPSNHCCDDEDEVKGPVVTAKTKMSEEPAAKQSRPQSFLHNFTIPKKPKTTTMSPKPSTSRLEDSVKQSSSHAAAVNKKKKPLFSHSKNPCTDLQHSTMTSKSSSSLLASSTPIGEDGPILVNPINLPKGEPRVMMKKLPLEQALWGSAFKSSEKERNESVKQLPRELDSKAAGGTTSTEKAPQLATIDFIPPTTDSAPVLENFANKLVAISEAGKSSVPAAKSSSNKSDTRRVIRHSEQVVKELEGDKVSVTSRYQAGPDEISSAARVAFSSSYKDLETLLGLKAGSRICPDLQWAASNSRNQLSNRYHTNFNFFLNFDNQELEAMGALRRLGRNLYPSPEDVHAILFRIIQNTKDRCALYRAQEFLYNLVSLHPPCSPAMRNFYWSVMCQHYDDPDWGSRWDYLHSLLGDLLKAPFADFERKTIANAPAGSLERKRAALALLVRLLQEDLHCWVRLQDPAATGPPSAHLNRKTDLPLIARLLWPQTDVGRKLSGPCKELMAIHVAALESKNRAVLCYTKSLVKMMADVVQLCDVPLPIKMRRPGDRMTEMAREISLMTSPAVACSESFLVSIRSTELRLLLSLSALRSLQPSIYSTGGDLLSLQGIFADLLTIPSDSEMVIRFRSRPEAYQRCFLTALFAYFKQFGSMKTWFLLRDRIRHKSKMRDPAERYSPVPEPVEMFSRSYNFHHLVDDLKQARRILKLTDEKSGGRTKILFAFSYP